MKGYTVSDEIKAIQNQIDDFLYQEESIESIDPHAIEKYLALVKQETGIQDLKAITDEIIDRYGYKYLRELITIRNRQFDLYTDDFIYI